MIISSMCPFSLDPVCVCVHVYRHLVKLQKEAVDLGLINTTTKRDEPERSSEASSQRQ